MSHSIALLPQLAFNNITADSRAVSHGDLFLAYPGEQSDGRAYIADAISHGAKAVLWESSQPLRGKLQGESFAWAHDKSIANLAVSGLKAKAGSLAAEFYHRPSEKLNVIGVTGTNGKTSVTQWLGQCLSALGQKTAVMGTIGQTIFNAQAKGINAATQGVCEKPLSFASIAGGSVNTTPDAIVLQRLLADCVAEKVQTVAMEVSSHGLDQGRVNGTAFDVAVFTNLTRDHLDYHGDMVSYGAAKQILFAWPTLKTAVINVDDAFGQQLLQHVGDQHTPCMTYGFSQADVQGQHLKLTQNGLSMSVATPQGNAEISAPVIGRFNADNLLAVLATLLALDFKLNDIVAVMGRITPVAGRMQQIGGGALPLVVVDYAHTPDALEKLLSTLKAQLPKEAKLVCVFGCGGNRDAGKRPLMGAIASDYADSVILTNDNPRHEAPEAIVHAIEVGMQAGKVRVQVTLDRAHAIALAINMATVGDIVVIAGKGHEDYQDIAGVKVPFSDLAVAREKLNLFAQTHGIAASLSEGQS